MTPAKKLTAKVTAKAVLLEDNNNEDNDDDNINKSVVRKTVVELYTHIIGANVPINQPLFDPDGNRIPVYFDPRKLTGLEREKIGWWDKTHPDVCIGSEKKKRCNQKRLKLDFQEIKTGM